MGTTAGGGGLMTAYPLLLDAVDEVVMFLHSKFITCSCHVKISKQQSSTSVLPSPVEAPLAARQAKA